MKILVTYNTKTGEIVFKQINATEQYDSFVEDVADNKEAIEVDVSTKKLKLADKIATTEEKEQLKRELESKNKELENKDEELLKAQADYAQLMYDSLLK